MFILSEYYHGDQIKESGTERASSMYEKDENMI
jgi:hypothetical protein